MLDLRRSQLSTLPAGVFAGLSSLRSVSLLKNFLQTLPEGIFQELGFRGVGA